MSCRFRMTAISTLAVSTALGAASFAAAQTYPVTSAADSGEGSLRAALSAAEAAGGTVLVMVDGDIEIASTLSYGGTAPLAIIGAGQTVSTPANVTLLAATGGADLTIQGLTFSGPGGYSINARGDVDQPAGKGIFVDVADDATGTVALTLTDVTVEGVAGHGIHVSDCTLADECGGGGGGAGEGSPASISVTLTGVVVNNVGNGRFDADGLRVDERGEGSIHARIVQSLFTGVGADGVELDEGQAGDVVIFTSGSAFNANGGYCDPDLLGAFMPSEPEGEFEEGAVMESAIPGPITGTPDDRCIERAVDLYDDGSVEEYEFAIDTDDGFDVDEAGPGNLIALVTGSQILDNLDEGLDYDEEGPGGIELTVVDSRATGNTDDGFKNSEEDEGGVTCVLSSVVSTGNGGKGFVCEEEDAGDVTVHASATVTAGNDDSDDTGLELVQDDDGTGIAIIVGSEIADGIDAEGVDVSAM